MIYMDLPDFFRCVRQDSGWSKDTPWLTQRFAYVPVFIYGTHQRGYSDHNFLKGYPVRGFGHTAMSTFTMYKSGNGEPIVFEEKGGTESARVVGELYQLPPSVVFALDKEMCNGLHFHRRPVHIRWCEIDDKHKAYDTRQDYLSDAFMYIADKAEFQKLAGWQSCRLMPKYNTSPTEGYVYRYNPLENISHRRAKALAQEKETDTAYVHQV